MATETMPQVLVIDDELGPRESLRFLLKNDYRVFCAESVERGLALLREHTPDVVIMDIRMPVCNGIEGLREIRRLDQDVAVIMLTGYGALASAQAAVRHAANDYVEKPFDAADMRALVEKHVACTQQRRRQHDSVNTLEQVRDRLTSELRRKESMAELGEASAEIVHDLRNALAVVYGSAELLRLERGEDLSIAPSEAEPPEDDALAVMEHTVRRCRRLLDAWQRLLRREPSQQRVFALAPVVGSAVASGQPAALGVQAELHNDYRAGEVCVRGDAMELERVLVNLIQNAIQALPPTGGRVRVAVARVDTGVCIRVQDNGCGIAPEALTHIFHPTFTTRSARGGMGLGLFIARKLVEAHGGSLTPESTLGQGTTMTIMLPVCTEPPSAPVNGAGQELRRGWPTV